MARRPAPQVGVGGCHHDAVRVGPVVVQTLPDTTGALGDISIVGSFLVHFQVAVRTAAEDFLTARAEVGQAGKDLFGRRSGRLVKMDRGHGAFFQLWMIRC